MHFNDRPRGGIGPGYLSFVVGAAVLAITGSYVLAGSGAQPVTKVQGLSVIIVGFVVVCFALHVLRSRNQTKHAAVVTDELNDVLEKLDLAGEVFAGSIKVDDMLRLISSRIREAIPADGIRLFLLDKTRQGLELAAADGADAVVCDMLSADLCFARREVGVSDDCVISIPLMRAGEPFGVLEMVCRPGDPRVEKSMSVVDAIATRISPLILNSLAFERSLTNALTDTTTDLPNERALFLILENQIAECQRKRDDRPLILLAIDIRRFDEINAKFGHVAGDRVLNFAAHVMRDNLRHMDFLARCNDDQFLAVLPTASKEISHEIIARITTALFARRLPINEDGSIEIELNVGWAAFGVDGESAEQLITAARLRKQQQKSPGPANVLWFSQQTAR